MIVGWLEMNGPARGAHIENILAQPVWLRWPIYYAIAASIVIFGAETGLPSSTSSSEREIPDGAPAGQQSTSSRLAWLGC